MALNNKNNISVLPFYPLSGTVQKRQAEVGKLQDRNLPYAFGEYYPLYVSNTRFINFVHKFEGTEISPASFDDLIVYLIPSNEKINWNRIDLHDEVPINSILIGTGEDTGIWFYNIGTTTFDLPIGQYYLLIFDNSARHKYPVAYSDVFSVVSDMTPYIRIEWWNDEDMIIGGKKWKADISSWVHSTGVKLHREIYLATNVGKPDYEFEEEVEQREGWAFPIKQVSYKRYKFKFAATEPMLDALRIIRMSDYVKIYDGLGNEWDCDTFLITPRWTEQGNIAEVDAEFTCDTIAKKIGMVKEVDLGVD